MTRKKKQPPSPSELDVDIEASRDHELRALVEANPADAEVYADWLEEQGDLPRASFLRMQQQLRALKVSHPKLLERGRALCDLGKTLDGEWIAAVTHPKLAGSTWDGRDDDGTLTLRFLASGFFNYTQPSGTFENGRWQQYGTTVEMETNAHYADYFGVIVGDTLRGNAHNIVDHKWKWKVKRTDDPSRTQIPEDTNRTIHDDHVRAREVKAKAKPERKPAKKKPAALTRKKPLKRKTQIQRKRKR
jgi:uncharacterized protein (TIGR02996 family)